MKEKPLLSLIGFGRLGAALASAAQNSGYRIAAVASPGEETRRRAAAQGFCAYADNAAAAAAGQVVILCVPDRQIEPVCLELTTGGRLRAGQILLHTSGASAAGLLAPAKAAGVAVGALHPLQTFAGTEADAEAFSGIAFAIDGDVQAAAAARKLVSALGGRCLEVPPQDRALYHAAAVLTSNYLTALLSVAEELAARWAPPGQAMEALLPLAQETLNNIRRHGTASALTGPIARGDIATVERHLQALPPALLPLYKELGLAALSLAADKLSPEREAALRRLLSTPAQKEELL